MKILSLIRNSRPKALFPFSFLPAGHASHWVQCPNQIFVVDWECYFKDENIIYDYARVFYVVVDTQFVEEEMCEFLVDLGGEELAT